MLNEKRLIEEFLELVQIDSETGYERKICDCLKDKFTKLGLEVFEDDTAKVTGHEAGNLICFLKGNKEGVPTVFFNSHMDTVEPGLGIKPSIKDGYIFSDGTTILGADDKAGIVALLETIRVLKENNLPYGDIQFIITVGEEAGLIGAKALDPKHLKAQFGYALDTGGKVGNIKAAAPACGTITASIYGKSSHAGVAPEKGVSAITIASKAISIMHLGRIDFESSANIGSFEANGPTNVVCDYAKVCGEARSFDNKKLDEQLKLMKEAFETVANEMGGRAEVDIEVSFPGFRLVETDLVVDIAKRATSKINRPCEIFQAGGGSDSNIFNDYGIPTVVLACGYEDIHTKNEKISIEELKKLVEMALAIVHEVTSN